MVILTLTEKGGEARQLTFDKNDVTIGRVQGNDVVLPKGNVSKRHCRILSDDGHFTIEDMKSTNGTYVNGRRIAEVTAVTGADKIYIGDFVIRIENAAAAGPPEAGSLSASLRRPPPPPPARAGTRTTDGEEIDTPAPSPKSRPSVAAVPPPPPPPPPARTGRATLSDGDAIPPSAADIDLDDDALGVPKLNVPPLKPGFPLSADEEEAAKARAPGDEDDVITNQGGRERRRQPAAGAAVPGDFPVWLRKLLENGATAVYVNGAEVEVERLGRRETSDVKEGDLSDSLRDLAMRGTPRPSHDAAAVNVTLPDGSRLSALFPPAANQVAATVRRGLVDGHKLADLVSEGALSKEMQQVLEACASTGRNVLCAGDRPAVETLLHALAGALEDRKRVIVLADRVGALRPGWVRVTPDPRNPDLIAAAVALRADHFIAEVSSASLAADILQQCALGLEGAFIGLPARSAQDALNRLQALTAVALGASGGTTALVAGSFDVIAHAQVLPSGGLRVVEISEPKVDIHGQLGAEPLLTWAPENGRTDGRASGGRFQVTGASARLASTLASRGAALPANILRT